MNNLIGNTPLIKINYEIYGDKKSFFTKLEWYSLTGSVKDRMAEYIILESKKLGILKENQTIVETTSGNTGIAISSLGALYNHKVVIFMPESVSKERIEIMKLYGAEINLIKLRDGGFKKCIELSKKYAEDNNAFLFNQFENTLNIEAQKSIANEVKSKLGKIHYFISGVGSGGTCMGVYDYLKDNDNFKLVVVEPYESKLLSGKEINEHKIEGIGDDFIPKIMDTNVIEKVIPIKSDDAILICKKIARELGLGVGISSGANALASIILNEETRDKNIVTIFSDDLKKYLSTDLTKEIKNSEFVNNIRFINYEMLN